MTSVLVVRRPWELDPVARVWGTGGWTSPEEREALDWLTLVRLLVWDVRTSTEAGGERPDVCVVACDPEAAAAGLSRMLGWAEAGSLVVLPLDAAPAELRAGLDAGSAGAGSAIRWTGIGDGGEWRSRTPVPHTALRPGQLWEVATEIDEVAVVAAARRGKGSTAVLGFHPSAARDASGAMTQVLVRLLTGYAPEPLAWLDLAGTVVLRMDDPGGAQNAYSRDWCYRKLSSPEWERVGDDLRRRSARISLAYSAGFVDDGDALRGRLRVGGREPLREAGSVHPSPLVTYEDVAGHSPGSVYDYAGEYAGIAALVDRGVASVELHGYTHLHPDLREWAAAPDRYEAMSWFRELGPRAAAALRRLGPGDHPLARGRAEIERWFNGAPTTLVCPGEEWTDDVLATALDLGVELVGSYYLALRHDDRFCWTTHVCSPYLDEPDPAWFDSPLPVVGYMHDRDLVHHGVEWLDRWLGEWVSAGATSFTDYREIAALLRAPVSLRRDDDGWVVAAGDGALRPATPVSVRVRTGDEAPVRFEVAGQKVLTPSEETEARPSG